MAKQSKIVASLAGLLSDPGITFDEMFGGSVSLNDLLQDPKAEAAEIERWKGILTPGSFKGIKYFLRMIAANGENMCAADRAHIYTDRKKAMDLLYHYHEYWESQLCCSAVTIGNKHYCYNTGGTGRAVYIGLDECD